jgi:transposase-like protein
MAGRKSPLKSTRKKLEKPPAAGGGEESKRKKAILDAVKRSSDSVKATLRELGLPQSTYYKWVRRYQAEGLDGLVTGNPVSDKVWKRFVDLEKRQKGRVSKGKLSAEETQTMTSEQDQERIKKLLFKRFDEEAPPEKEAPAEAPEPKTVEKPPSAPSYTPPPEEPKDKTFKYAVGALACVIAILLLASLSNSSKFAFKQNDQMVELWQGRFAPMGWMRVASFSDPKILTGVAEKTAYSKKKAYGILSDYFINRADEILRTGETPDLKAAKSYLSHASKYALSDARREEVSRRLSRIHFLVLLGKGELARSKGTVSDFETAKGYLTQAIPFASTDFEKDMLTKSLAAIEYAIAESKISQGEKQLADLYREAMDRHLKKAKEYDPQKAQAIDQEIEKIKKWLTEFEGQGVGPR